jgi:hypothetical protein
MKSGNLNFLEPSGSLQAFNGTVYLPLFVDKFRVAELTKERERCKFIPGLFFVGLNI